MEYSVLLPEFEGPLDLLLHLVKKNDINIFDIDINLITEQYLKYIKAMEELNLDIASEYLVMASDLIQIKSKTLLPVEENDEEDDAREELINKLLDYQIYKESTEKLREYEKLRKEVHTREPIIEEYRNDIELDLGISIEDLVFAINKLISNNENSKPLQTKVTNKEYSVGKRSIEIRNILRKKKRIEFKELFDVYSKEYVIVTLLAILSMTKRQEIIIKQDNNFDNIFIESKG